MKRTILFSASVLFLFQSKTSFSQDPEFTQFYATPIYTNPAMAGTGQCDGGGRAVLNYRTNGQVCLVLLLQVLFPMISILIK